VTSLHRLDAAMQLVDLLQHEVDAFGPELRQTRLAGQDTTTLKALIMDSVVRLRKARAHVTTLIDTLDAIEIPIDLTEEIL
jgi:hypothetical protein